ncbi:hypothetical protein U9M48_041650 [Paspalum notatum var. saurae]|uniref:Serine/threonine-protein kinase BSK1-like TPR repeats domain-containing protein n=1 Tax=Paspalum notatum var. saurae TaxID=547442 RepID=A0AAQ3XF39_PASNO
MAAPSVDRRPSTDDNDTAAEAALFKAVRDGDLARFKESLGTRTGNRAGVFSLSNKHGFGVLHQAACWDHLKVCKYLVEELGGDPNITAKEGLTPVMSAARSDAVSTLKYLLDNGAELMKPDDKGLSVLHHAVSTGSCNATEFLLSKGIPVDIDFGIGTPLHRAACAGQDKTMKILLDHHANAGADVNGKGTVSPPLWVAASMGGCTDFIQLLLKAGADPNIPDNQFGRLPIEEAAAKGCREEVEMLFPMTLPIPNVSNWSIDGVISHAKLEAEKPLSEQKVNATKDLVKSLGNKAFTRKEYELASETYSLILDHEPDATLYSNRSLCKLLMGDGEGALSDACLCRMMRPDWAKACYRQAAAYMLLKEYRHAHDALLDAQELDPGSEEIKRELRKAAELMKISSEAEA